MLTLERIKESWGEQGTQVVLDSIYHTIDRYYNKLYNEPKLQKELSFLLENEKEFFNDNKEIIDILVNKRNDYFSSDREVLALMLSIHLHEKVIK